MQIINLPNLHIIDFGFGFTGSTHDLTAWEKTCVFEEHETIFEEGEFIWANSAYPVCTLSVMFKSSLNSEIYSNQIQTWVVVPYKRPKRRSLPCPHILCGFHVESTWNEGA